MKPSSVIMIEKEVTDSEIHNISLSSLDFHHIGGCGEDEVIDGISFVDYRDESQLNDVMRLVGADLSEPYSSKSMQLPYSTHRSDPIQFLPHLREFYLSFTCAY
jgi:hypothetical protein